MKIRTGFVSNSSSSSYILALSEESDCEHCGHSNAKILELIIGLFSSGQLDSYIPKSFAGDPNHLVSMIGGEIEELDKDIKCALKKIETLESISKNDDAISLFSQWYNIQQHTEIRHRRWGFEGDYKESPRDELRDDVKRLGDRIARDRNKKTALEIKKVKIEKAVKSGQTIYSFEIDNLDSAHRIIEGVIRSGYVEVIDKVTT